ncbi:hypothetical protein SLA2020_440940 [Shorea laevis]
MSSCRSRSKVSIRCCHCSLATNSKSRTRTLWRTTLDDFRRGTLNDSSRMRSMNHEIDGRVSYTHRMPVLTANISA